MPRKKNYKPKDSDADGLPDEVEKFFGTDPHNPDTDGDGVPDGEEVRRGRNPLGPGLLKDLFIPHKGNDYEPRALHPYRLLFYALSSILLKAILIGAVIILPVEAWLTPDILAEQSKKIVSLTNEIRKNLNLSLLAESPRLDQAAFNKAQDMIFKQYFAHTGPDNRSLADWLKALKYNFAVAGENLAMGFSSPEDVVNGWTRSQTHYRNMVDPDFKEIGVGTASGLYNSVDTTFVAQYFASSTASFAEPEAEAEAPLAGVELPAKPAVSADRQILGEKKVEKKSASAAELTVLKAEVRAEAVDLEPPQIDQERSRLYIDQPRGKTEKIVRAEVYLSADAIKARAHFNNYFIDLKPEDSQSGRWTGRTIIFGQNQEQIFNPVVLASVTAEDRAGNTATRDLNWDKIMPARTTLLKQYYFIKQHQPAYIKPLFDITSFYYKIILILASIVLALNVLIQFKKQHPHLILSTLGLIGLLAALIIL
ncbi:MAG: CAP domain-containing protein [bacterium]|nr:CAP domain-containing protein [bacterium]